MVPTSPHAVRRRVRSLAAMLAPLAVLAAATTAPAAHAVDTPAHFPAQPGVAASATNPDNPLANRPWGIYQGPGDAAWQPYVDASGTNKQLLTLIAGRTKAKWFGQWIPTGDIARKVYDYVTSSTDGDPNTLAQLTLFRLKPWEGDACRRLPTYAEKTAYKQWIDGVALGLQQAQSHVAIVLQPDGPFALCEPHGSRVLSRLIKYSAIKLSAVPNTSVYIEAGAADWNRDDPRRAARILIPAGVQYVRGFALNGTHYDATAREIRFGAKVVAELASRGIPGRHFVVNTSSNGKPFAGYHYKGANFFNARACTSSTDSRCVTLGIPPTADVANPRWGLASSDAAKARAYLDGYLWWGRPWLYNQTDPFSMPRALQLARTTPFS